jgi:hypothetical protein
MKTAKEILYQKDGIVRKYYSGMYADKIKYDEEDVIKAMQEYSNQELAESKRKLKEVIDKTNIDAFTKEIVKAIVDHLEDL